MLLLELLARGRILVGLGHTKGGPSQGWTDGQMILAVMSLNVAGLDRAADINQLEADRGLRQLVRRFEPQLFGMPRRVLRARFRGGRDRCFPSARSIRDWLDRFHVEGAHDGERERGTAYLAPHTERHELFRKVNRRLMNFGPWKKIPKALTLDLDATIIASGKRECWPTYRAATGEVPGERGYQPLIAFCRELGMTPWLEFRDGNVPASLDNARALDETLAQLPAVVERVTLRTDGAGHQEAVIRACNNPARRSERTRRFRVVGLIAGATLSKALLEEVKRLPEDAWSPVASGIEPASGDEAGDLECAELPFVSNMDARSRPEDVIRYVATRRPIPWNLGFGESERPAADGKPSYRFRAYLTNFPAPDALPLERANGLEVMEAGEVVRAAHERCGRGEQVHSALKSDLAGGMMPSGRFGANAAWLWLAALTMNVMALACRTAYGPEWLWARMKRLRAVWLHLAARLVRHGRRFKLVFDADGARLLAAFQRLKRATSPPTPVPG